jgi:hypothetical protein
MSVKIPRVQAFGARLDLPRFTSMLRGHSNMSEAENPKSDVGIGKLVIVTLITTNGRN